MDLSVFSPACLPDNNETGFVGQKGHVYGESAQPAMMKFHPYFILGWGDTGVTETSTDKLQETVVPIVLSSNCAARMKQDEGASEDLIVCAGGAESGGPCKVNHKPKVCIVLNDLNLGRQWRSNHSKK